jgi:hypothetical protein
MNEQPKQPIGKTIAQIAVGFTLGYAGCYVAAILLVGLCFLALIIASAILR